LGLCGIVQITCGKSGRFLRLTLVYEILEVILMFAGIKWGAVGIAAARVVTLVVATPGLLYYSFAGTPVSVRDFFQGCWRPVAASLAMGGVLLLVQRHVPLESALVSLLVGLGTAVVAYLLAFILLPGGRAQLQVLTTELLKVVRRRKLGATDE
jgi:PST family polysaccharide transporter